MEVIPDEEQETGYMNDHNGYKICELFVEKKYSSFKEEISNYKYLNMKQYEEIVVVKANNYVDAKATKNAKPSDQEEWITKLHYAIEMDNTTLGYKNLVCLILYTDFSELSADFSASFRRKSVFEPISDTKERNSYYWWWSKILRETVELFGQCRYKADKTCLEGPFYTGMSVVLTLSEFNIFLCSPTSTSAQIEVALKFGGENGMVIQLNNTSWGDEDILHGFNVCWLSRYKEEDERC